MRKTPPPHDLTEPRYRLHNTDATQRELIAMIPHFENAESTHSIITLAHAWADANTPGCHSIKITRDARTCYVVHENADDPENIHEVAAMSRTVYIKKETTNDQ